MFAIAIWDRSERTLTLVRDRLGIKPLYWAKLGGLFLFGSELKALRAHPGWTPRIDRGAVAAFMRHNYIPAPHSIYQGVHKLEPGSILTLPWRASRASSATGTRARSRMAALPIRCVEATRRLTDQLETLLRDAVRRRMVADVPLGAFLSGGIDSSTVVALMQAQCRPVRTFTIGFDIRLRRSRARRGGRETSRHRAHRDDRDAAAGARRDPAAAGVLRRAVRRFVADPDLSGLAMTRQHVTVALSGDGGDELFGGYNRYQFAAHSGER